MVAVTSDLIRTFVGEVWNRRRLDLLDELVAEDYELRNLADGSVPVRGREELHEHIAEWLAAFPDLHLQETDHLAAGERAVSISRITGSHTGAAFQGFRPSGARIDVAIVAIFECAGERLASHGTLLDAQRLVEQLAGSDVA